MSGFQVGPETWVTVRAQVFDAEGEAAAEPEVIGFVFGLGSLIPKVERALEMKNEGDKVVIELYPADAFGVRDPARVLEVDRAEFPEDVAPGDRFEVENEDGGLLVLSVLEVLEDAVVVDSNHPLSDQTVKMAVEVLEVRPATEEELALAFEEANEFSEAAKMTTEVPLVPVESLLRGRSRR